MHIAEQRRKGTSFKILYTEYRAKMVVGDIEITNRYNKKKNYLLLYPCPVPRV
jgi:hypothetical protein